MDKRSKLLYSLGAILAIFGSFLPWEIEGDFVSYWKYGINIDFSSFSYWLRSLHVFPIKDNGGLLFISLSIIIYILVFYPPKFLKHLQRWLLACTAILAILSVYHLTSLSLRQLEFLGMIGAPSIQIGLVMVSLGSMLLLYASISDYRKYQLQGR